MKKNLSVSREMRIQVNQHKRENLIVETVVDTVGVWGGERGQNRGDYIHRALSRPRSG